MQRGIVRVVLALIALGVLATGCPKIAPKGEAPPGGGLFSGIGVR